MGKNNINDKLHIGLYLRNNVLPKGMTITKAAKMLGVGRPALSNLLNGKAALSPDMAARIERTFGMSAHALMDMQAANKADNAKRKVVSAVTKSYVPPFLHPKASDIESWAESISARSRLAVFLRTLVNSTGLKLERSEFPGNDDSERPGWDGFVEAGEATPWIPLGKSGWEFGVNQDPKRKADKDYAKSVKQVSEDERKDTTFIFVTPRRWPRKVDWENKHRAQGKWKDVRVLDASNLEEWLEQSIPAQAWLANEHGIPSDGVLSLEACWQQWVADCNPPPVEMLFEPAVEAAKTITKTRISKSPNEPIVITTDSTLEALAFLHCLFSPDDPDLSLFRDRVVVFNTPGTLSKLASKYSHFIAVVPNREVEMELAQQKNHLRSIIIYPHNATNIDPDVNLEPLSFEPFDRALHAMGCGRDEINRLTHESGRSLTVLRRRLSNTAAIRTPSWAADQQTAKSREC